jgi:hypothetical protein
LLRRGAKFIVVALRKERLELTRVIEEVDMRRLSVVSLPVRRFGDLGELAGSSGHLLGV